MDHEMKYRAGLLTASASWSPHWYCTCGDWVFYAFPMYRRKTGNNKIEAEKAFAAHSGQPSPWPKRPRKRSPVV